MIRNLKKLVRTAGRYDRLSIRIAALEFEKAQAKAWIMDTVPLGETLAGPWKIVRSSVDETMRPAAIVKPHERISVQRIRAVKKARAK